MRRLKKFKGVIYLIIFLIVQSTLAQQTAKYVKEIQRFEDFIQKQMKTDRIPGLSIGFMKADFIWTKGFGYADLENKTPATEKSAYRLASNTKSMTAAAILQLVEKGKIDLDAEVQRYVPYFPRKRWPVTVRQLLGHIGGMSHYKNYDLEGHIKEHKDTRDALAIFADFDLVAEPGSRYYYSSYGYNLLGAVVEGASKQSFGDYMREHVWGLLGMTDTHMDDPDEIISDRVRGYRLIDGELKNSEFIDISSRFAGGGTRSTVIDMLKYVEGYRSEKILRGQTIDLMYTSMATRDGRYTDYGMGWNVRPINGRFVVSHSGSQAETRTYLIRFPAINFAIALAYNFEGADRTVYVRRLYELITDEPWNMNPYTGDRINDVLYSGFWDVFNYGLSYFDRYQNPLTADQELLAEAFNYFNTHVSREAIQSDFGKSIRKIRDGRHPVAGDAFVKIGSYMAAKLHERLGASGIGPYHRMGAIRFFHDYVIMCQATTNYPKELRFSESIEKLVAQWGVDWKKTCTDDVLRLAVTPYSDIKEIGKRLKKIFSGSTIYPDFGPQLTEVTRYFYIKGDQENAMMCANLAADLYPESPIPYVLLANTHVCFGKKDEALEFYKKAKEINPIGRAVSAGSLNGYAVELASFGQLEKATDLLQAAVKLYPEEAVLYNSMAEIHLRRARSFYQKALDNDPTFAPARDRLKNIQ